MAAKRPALLPGQFFWRLRASLEHIENVCWEGFSGGADADQRARRAIRRLERMAGRRKGRR